MVQYFVTYLHQQFQAKNMKHLGENISNELPLRKGFHYSVLSNIVTIISFLALSMFPLTLLSLPTRKYWGFVQSLCWQSKCCLWIRTECSNWYLLTNPVYANCSPTATCVVFLLFAMRLTFTTGTINGIIFYGNAANIGWQKQWFIINDPQTTHGQQWMLLVLLG